MEGFSGRFIPKSTANLKLIAFVFAVCYIVCREYYHLEPFLEEHVRYDKYSYHIVATALALLLWDIFVFPLIISRTAHRQTWYWIDAFFGAFIGLMLLVAGVLTFIVSAEIVSRMKASGVSNAYRNPTPEMLRPTVFTWLDATDRLLACIFVSGSCLVEFSVVFKKCEELSYLKPLNKEIEFRHMVTDGGGRPQVIQVRVSDLFRSFGFEPPRGNVMGGAEYSGYDPQQTFTIPSSNCLPVTEVVGTHNSHHARVAGHPDNTKEVYDAH